MVELGQIDRIYQRSQKRYSQGLNRKSTSFVCVLAQEKSVFATNKKRQPAMNANTKAASVAILLIMLSAAFMCEGEP